MNFRSIDRRKRVISVAESEGECSFQEIHSQLEYEEPHSSRRDDSSSTTQVSSSPQSSSTRNDATKPSNDMKLMIVFILLVVFGSGNAVLNKLSAIPMYNYPNFLNLWSTLLYIPLCFGYIWPMIAFGSAITPDQLNLSKRPFAIMGALDCLASIMQTFYAVLRDQAWDRRNRTLGHRRSRCCAGTSRQLDLRCPQR